MQLSSEFGRIDIRPTIHALLHQKVMAAVFSQMPAFRKAFGWLDLGDLHNHLIGRIERSRERIDLLILR